MADFAKIYAHIPATMALYDALIADATENAPIETSSSTKIQKVRRGAVVRALLTIKRNAATNIERVFRGSVARNFTNETRTAKSRREDLAVFHYHAMILQRTFRGFYSRRYYHDYAARKAYIQSVVEKGNRLRETLAVNLENQRIEEETRMLEKEQEEFKKVTSNLHHLLSTKSMPGIYNSPYVADAPPTAMGIPVEEHLRAGVKDLLKTRLTGKVKMTRDLNGTLRIPIRPPTTRRSLQATGPYDAVEQAEKMEAKLGKKRWAGGARNILGGGKVKDPPYQRGVSEGTPFLDMYKNPFFMRGEPEKAGEKTTVPFYTSVGGNKSSVQPNGIFDVILDAELEGDVNKKVVLRTMKKNAFSKSLGAESDLGGESLIIPETS
ncbi:hypothetical protein TrCOL_g5927 [Triparma columacea]|jgi:hypothetical protein|uniref:Uncharacterized protein n=1 Tax=Triparma columacea TaxID=722753 RepID=A0A9W7GD12_9STRA|nr:hypothetical protein TrCOL_g5927 [Triparma columacea]